jgi:hypothetical protein
MLEWALWWDRTIARWQDEGLPSGLDRAGVKRHCGLDVDHQIWVDQFAGMPARVHGHGWVADLAGYETIRGRLFPDQPWDRATLHRQLTAAEAAGELRWATFLGFFWFPREILGIEPHLYALHDQPELIHRINEDQCSWIERQIDILAEDFAPDFVTLAEDMSYNHGPMLSRRTFETLLAPYYRRIVPAFHRRGIKVIVDSDGDVARLLPWLVEVGTDGILPLERQAGCDINRLQDAFPEQVFIGHYDKMVMPLGEAAMRAEFERLLPAMRRGRFIPSVDHQTPPGVSYAQYQIYMRLFREYAEKACR